MEGNRLCHLLGIKYPIVQAPMNWITGAGLAAAVSNAGGLGTLGPNAGADTITADVTETAERLRRQIRKIKTLTDKPFAVNVLVGYEGLELSEAGRKYSQRCIEVVLEEGITIAVTSVGPANVYTRKLKDAGVKVLHAVSTASQAKKAEQAGVDAVICEGYEGGGHKALTELTTMVMVPMVADIVKIPILAAGGIADARGMVAAMALGADGVYMGTRFIATHESDAHPRVKQAILESRDACTVTVNKWLVCGRDLRNSFTKKYNEMIAQGASVEGVFQQPMYHALVKGEVDEGEIPCGQDAAMVGNMLGAAEVIESIMREVQPVMKRLKARAVLPATAVPSREPDPLQAVSSRD
jgi:enoyl-[acyl-carrier protein] reductase II